MKFCRQPFEFFYVGSHGRISLCPWAEITMGNILKESLEDIWNSENAKELRDSVLDGSFHYCNHAFCPYLSEESLPDASDKEISMIIENVKNGPVTFSLAYDLTCNHNCPSCRSEIYVADEQDRAELEEITEKISSYLDNSKTIVTNGQGELFASKYIMKLLQELDPVNPDFKLAIETNGALFDEQNWEKIKHLSGYDISVVVTPNSFERGTYRYLAGKENDDELDKLLSNLEFLSKLRKTNDINYLQINFVIQESNFREAPEFCERALEKFAADRVAIKPLHRWFAMSADEAWFKDVLNPKHPYHQEYLRMKDDPRLKNPKVWDWTGGKNHKSKDHPAYQYKIFCDLLYKLLSCQEPKQAITQYFNDRGIENIAIYGAWDFGIKIYHLLKNSDIRIKYFIDKWKGGTECCGTVVRSLHQSDHNDVQCIIVTPIVLFDEIEKDLRREGYKGIILSLEDLINRLP